MPVHTFVSEWQQIRYVLFLCAAFAAGNEYVQFGYLGSATGPKRCLEVAVEKRKVRCENTAGWTDGTNACSIYEYEEEIGNAWCSLYGGGKYANGNAKRHCCVCGGGSTQEFEAFEVGDKVQALVAKDQWADGEIVKIRPKPGFKYEVRFISMQRRGKTGYSRVLLKQETSVRNRAIKAWLQTRLCDPHRPSQRWQILNNTIMCTLPSYGSFRLDSSVTGQRTLSQVASNKLNHAQTIRLSQAFTKDIFPNMVQIKGGNNRCLAAGKFGSPAWEVPQFVSCKDPMYDHFLFIAWQMISLQHDHGTKEDEDEFERLTELVRLGGVDAVTPWDLLGIERSSSIKEVKSAFRDCSRALHPDKRRRLADNLNEMTFAQVNEAADALYLAAREAYDGLTATTERERQRFRQKYESQQERLFVTNQIVRELSPSDFSPGYEYLNVSESSGSSGELWLIFLYSSSCSMSRAVAPLVKMIAPVLHASSGTHFGTYACGGFGETKELKKKDGFKAVFKDPICTRLEPGFKETPRIVAIVNGPESTFRLSFDSVMATNLTSRLIDFAARARYLLDLSSTIHFISTAHDYESFFARDDTNEMRLVLYIGSLSERIISSPTDTDRALGQTLAGHFAVAATPFLHFGSTLAIMHCDMRAVLPTLCRRQGVQWTPAVFFGNTSIMDEPFSDLRDFQIALTAFANGLRFAYKAAPSTALAHLIPDDDQFEDLSDGDSAGSSSCGASSSFSTQSSTTTTEDAPALEKPKSPPRHELPFQPKEQPPAPPPRRLEPRTRGSSSGRRGNSILYGGGGAVGSSSSGRSIGH